MKEGERERERVIQVTREAKRHKTCETNMFEQLEMWDAQNITEHNRTENREKRAKM